MCLGSLLVTWQRWPWPMAAATHGPKTEMDVLRWRWIEVDVLDRRANIYDDGNCTCISIIICEHTSAIRMIIWIQRMLCRRFSAPPCQPFPLHPAPSTLPCPPNRLLDSHPPDTLLSLNDLWYSMILMIAYDDDDAGDDGDDGDDDDDILKICN